MMAMLKKNVGGVGVAVFELVVGVLLLIDPVGFTSGIIAAAGIVLMLMGALDVARYFMADAKEAAQGQKLSRGLGMLLAGGFFTIKNEWFIATFPVLTILYGAALLVSSLSKIQHTADLLRAKDERWVFAAISAAVCVVCAGVILCWPFASTLVLWIFTGAVFVAEAVLDLMALFMKKKGAGKA